MATETLQLIINVTNGGGASAEIQNIERSSRSASASLLQMNRSLSLTKDTLRFMRGALVAISFAKIFEEIASGISTMQQIHNLLTQVTSSSRENGLMFEKLGDAANKVRAPLEDFAKTFVNIERSSAAYKVSTNDIIKATQTMFASFAMSGLDESAIRNVSKDLREVFNLGIVQGRQFRAVVTQDQYLALQLSQYMTATGAGAAAVNRELEKARNTGKSVNIYEMSMQHKGAFTGADVLQALIKANDKSMQDLNKTTVTLGQAFTVLSNQWLLFLQGLNDSTGIFAILSHWIMVIASYLPEITLFAAAIGAMLAINFVTSAFLNFASLVGGALKFVLSPILAIGEAIVMLPFRIGGAISAVSTFGSVMVAAFTFPYRAILALNTAVFSFVKYINTAISASVELGSTVSESIMSLVAGAMTSLVGLVGNLVVGFVTLAAIAIPAGAAIYGAWLALKTIFSELAPVFDDALKSFTRLGLTMQDLPLIIQSAFGDVFSHFGDYKELLGAFGTLFGDTFVRYFVAALHAGTHDVVAAIQSWFQSSWLGKLGTMLEPDALGFTTMKQKGVGDYLKGPSQEEKNAQGQVGNLMSNIMSRVAREAYQQKMDVEGAQAHGGTGQSDVEGDKAAQEKLRKATESFTDYISGMAPGGAVLKAVDEAQKHLNDAMHAGVKVQEMLKNSGLTWADVIKHQEMAAAGLKSPLDELFKKEKDIAELQKSHVVTGPNGKPMVVGPAIGQDEGTRRTNDAIMQAAGLKGAEQDLHDQEIMLKQAVDARLISQQAMNAVMEKAKTDQAAYLLELQNTATASAQAVMMKNQPGLMQGQWGAEEASSLMKVTNATAEYQAKLESLNAVAATGALTQQQYSAALRDLQIEVLKTQTDITSGLEVGILEAQKSMNDLATTVSGTVTKAFEGLTDELSKFFMTGKANFKQLEQQIESGMMHTAVQGLITGPLANLMGGLIPGMGGIGGAHGHAQLGADSSHPLYVTLASDGSLLDSVNNGLLGGNTPAGHGAPGGVLGPLAGGSSGGGTVGAGSSEGGLLGSLFGSGSPSSSSSTAGGIGSSSNGFLGNLFNVNTQGGTTGLLNSPGTLFGQGGFFSNLLNGGGDAGSLSQWILGGGSSTGAGSNSGLLSDLGISDLFSSSGSTNTTPGSGGMANALGAQALAQAAGPLGMGGMGTQSGPGEATNNGANSNLWMRTLMQLLSPQMPGGMGGGSSPMSGLMGMFGGSSGAASMAPGQADAGGLGLYNMITPTDSAAVNGSSGMFSGIGDMFSNLFDFANGGEFQVGGVGGVDSQLVAFRASPDETVSIKRPGQSAQPINGKTEMHLHLNGVQDVDSFRRSSSQVTAGMMALSTRASSRNGSLHK